MEAAGLFLEGVHSLCFPQTRTSNWTYQPLDCGKSFAPAAADCRSLWRSSALILSAVESAHPATLVSECWFEYDERSHLLQWLCVCEGGSCPIVLWICKQQTLQKADSVYYRVLVVWTSCRVFGCGYKGSWVCFVVKVIFCSWVTNGFILLLLLETSTGLLWFVDCLICTVLENLMPMWFPGA